MRKHLLLLAAGLVAAIAVTAHAQNAAKVNGVTIPSVRVDAMVKVFIAQGQADSPQLRQRVRDDLIMREILSQEAARMGLAKLPEVNMQLDLSRQNVLSQAFVQDFAKKNAVSDAEITSEYERIRKTQGDREYKSRHILVKGEEDAKGIVAKLKGGVKFEDLAKQSEDPGSKDKGGDLDWAQATNFVPEFSKALTALKKGEVTEVPVKTQFGFHVIRLDDVRDLKFPSVDEARPRITEMLQQQRFQKMLAEMRAKAKIE